MENDPISEMSQSLQTAVGSDEVALRARLGNDGYETYMKRSNALEDLTVADKTWHTEHSKQSVVLVAAQSQLISAKAGFWRALSILVPAIVALGAGWSAWEWLR